MISPILEPEAEPKQPELAIRFSIPRGATLEQAQEFGKGLMAQVEVWHKEFEPHQASVDISPR